MAWADTDGKARLWAVVFAVAAPAFFALPLVLFDTIGVRGSQPLVDVLLDALYVLALISAVASGFVGGLPRGVAATSMVWLLIVLIMYVALDPACPLEMSQRPDRVAAIGTIDSSATATCMRGATPTRGNNIGFAVLGGAAATLLATVGGLIGAVILRRPVLW